MWNKRNFEKQSIISIFKWSVGGIMKEKYLKQIFILVIASFLIGCTSNSTNKVQKQNNTFNVSNSKIVNAGIDLKVGTLNINSSNNHNISSKITFSRSEWKPIIEDTKNSDSEHINISQPDMNNISKGKNDVNKWNLSFSENVPVNMTIKTKVGDVTADLRKVQLNKLDIDMKTGKLYLDISGDYKKNLNMNLNCGVGETTIYFPENIGVKVKIKKHFIAKAIDSTWFTNNGDEYTNSKYGKTNVTIYATVNANVGKINLKTSK